MEELLAGRPLTPALSPRRGEGGKPSCAREMARREPRPPETRIPNPVRWRGGKYFGKN
jgi:hypothetical protein